jgi:hypothetical protein
MFIPIWALALAAVIALGWVWWSLRAVAGRNPLPFPDGGSRIFAAASAEGKEAVVALLARHGVEERFRMDTPGVLRSILWDGTIINVSTPEVIVRLDGASAAIGLVSADPERSAEEAAAFLRERGFNARVVAGVEPGVPVAFVLTDALAGSAINFRRHVLRMPKPKPAPKPR